MRYCINPDCIDRVNPDEAASCCSCQTPLLIHHRYYLVRALREEFHPYTEVFVTADVQHPERQKVLKTLISTNAKVSQLFQQEQTLLQEFRHPGIPRGEAAFAVEIPSTGKTLPALVMEKIDGITLEQWLQEYGTFDQQQAINLLGQMACILSFIHQRHYFHRDVKPANIMWSHRTGQFVLIDFGSARLIAGDAQANRQTATMVGTSGYTAPEQWHGNAIPQSDFYALGMTLLHLLTGQHPDSLPDRSDWRSHIPKPIVSQLADLIDTLTATNSIERPQTASSLLQQLAQIDPTLTLYAAPVEARRRRTDLSLPQISLPQISAMPWLRRRLVWGTGLVLLGGLSLAYSTDLSRWLSWQDRQAAVSQPVPSAESNTFADYANQAQIPLGLWQYGGSTAWAAIQRIDARIQVVIPQFQIASMQSVIAQPSTGKGIEMLIEGKLDFALASRTVSNEEHNRAQQRGFYLTQIPVAYDAISVVVHPNLGIAGLTINQLVDIYIGKVINWRELGGPDLLIRPLNGEPTGGAPAILKEYFPPGADYSPTVELINNPSDAIQKISLPARADQGSIYFASANNLIGQCRVKPLKVGRTKTTLVAPYQAPLVTACPNQRNQLNPFVMQSGQYPLTRKLFVVVREDESISTQAGKTYANLLLTQEGQTLIQQAGFVPLRSFEPR